MAKRTKKTPQRDRLGRARKHLGEAQAYDSSGHHFLRQHSLEAAISAVVDYLECEQDERDSVVADRLRGAEPKEFNEESWNEFMNIWVGSCGRKKGG
jgi:hypothetical protein